MNLDAAVNDSIEIARSRISEREDYQKAACVLAGAVERLRAELAAAKAASVISNDEQDGEQIRIRGISHFYGDLWILKDGDEYFWLLDDYNGGDWQPITKQLYEALLDHNRRADTTPPAT